MTRTEQRVLGVYAHPDDETFCSGGTFARYAAEGSDIMLVSATRGEAGQIRSASMLVVQIISPCQKTPPIAPS